MTRFSEVAKRPVMSTDAARTLGIVTGFVIDPDSKRVIALRLTKTPASGDTLHWEDLTAFGPDAITVPSDAVIVAARGPAAELRGNDADVMGKRLLTDAGTELGTVVDVDFDPETGAVQYLISADDRIAGSRLLGCGSYAVIVRAV